MHGDPLEKCVITSGCRALLPAHSYWRTKEGGKSKGFLAALSPFGSSCLTPLKCRGIHKALWIVSNKEVNGLAEWSSLCAPFRAAFLKFPCQCTVGFLKEKNCNSEAWKCTNFLLHTSKPWTKLHQKAFRAGWHKICLCLYWWRGWMVFRIHNFHNS